MWNVYRYYNYDTQVLVRKGTNGNLGLIQNRYYLKVLYVWTERGKTY